MQNTRISFTATLFAIMAFSAAAASNAVHAAELKVGDEAPDFELPGIDDSSVKLSSFEKKKNTVVVFSRAHWCPFCMGHLKQLAKSYEKIAETGTEVIVVFREERNGEDGLKRSKKTSSATFPLVLDLGKIKTAKYSSDGYATYVIDKSGKISAIHKGTKKNRPQPEAILKSLKSLK